MRPFCSHRPTLSTPSEGRKECIRWQPECGRAWNALCRRQPRVWARPWAGGKRADAGLCYRARYLPLNDYLHLTTVPFRHDKSSEHRLKRARQLVSEVPATARNLTTLWRVLGDTVDHAYPLYRHATAATATFDLEGGGMLLVHEAGSPLDAATRLVTFEMKRPRAASEDGDALQSAAGARAVRATRRCAHTQGRAQRVDHTSDWPDNAVLAAAWQTPLGVADANVTLGVIIHHGSARNGDTYLCSMFNGLVQTLWAVEPRASCWSARRCTSFVMGPLPTELYWDANGGQHGERNWKWGGNSSADLSASISTFSVLDEIVATMLDKTLYPHLERGCSSPDTRRRADCHALCPREQSRAPRRPRPLLPANPSSYTYLDGLRPVQPGPVAVRQILRQHDADDAPMALCEALRRGDDMPGVRRVRLRAVGAATALPHGARRADDQSVQHA